MRENRDRKALGGIPEGPLVYGLTALFVLTGYGTLAVAASVGGSRLAWLMAAGVALSGLFLLPGKGGLPLSERLIRAVIAAGIVLRVGYMLYTPFTLRGHDIRGWNEDGHYAYMYTLLTTGRLPVTNAYQFYHPPLEHLVQVLAVRFFDLFQSGAELQTRFEAAKVVPCFASCAMLWICRSLCRSCGLSSRATALALALLAFHPAFIILSASVNNDALMLLFFLLSILFTLRWYRNPTYGNILLIALSIGLSMMAKLSGGLAALFTGPVFLIALIRAVREGRWRPLAGQFAVFAALCVPLGLWYPIRNYVLFEQPLGYVYPLPAGTPLYCGDHSIAERFLSFPARQLFDPLYCRPMQDYNVWIYTVKCSLFGEFSFDASVLPAAVLLIVNVFLIAASLAAMAAVLFRGRDADPFARYGLFFIWLAQMVSFIGFNIRYPYGCTMDYRYILPTAVTGAAYLGLALDRLGGGKLLSRALYAGGCTLIALFAAASALFFIMVPA